MKRTFTLIAAGIVFLWAGQRAFGQITIAMQKVSGVYLVPCTVNGLELSFIFDTGANNISISLSEAMYMMKHGFLREDDVIGKEYFQDATGNIGEGTRINIREIEFAGLLLHDVEATVVHELFAPLLLGQSVISRLGKIQIDPYLNTLTIMIDCEEHAVHPQEAMDGGTQKIKIPIRKKTGH